MSEYTATIDMGEGGTTTIRAESLAGAVEQARGWAEAGEWREDGTVVVRVSGPDGAERVDVPVTAAR